jgi:chromosome segregation ATPase
MSTDDNGSWVRFADHEREVAALKAQVKTLSKGLDQDDEMIATLKERIRVSTQRIIEQIGATGPEDLEGAVGRLVEHIAQLTRELEQARIEIANRAHFEKSLAKQRDKLMTECNQACSDGLDQNRVIMELEEALELKQTDLTTLRGLVLEVVNAGVSMEDERVCYKEVQIDRDWFDKARATLAGKEVRT